MKIGVLGLQGAVAEHCRMIEKCGVEAIVVKKRDDLTAIAGLIIPGGESTTIGKLIVKYSFDEAILEKIKDGMSIFGTCTGMILLAKEIIGISQFKFGLMDIAVLRNAYGRQVDSCEHSVSIPTIGEDPFPTVFIRAPKIVDYKDNVNVLAKWGDDPILVKQGKFLAASFHPELTNDIRIHRYFINNMTS